MARGLVMVAMLHYLWLSFGNSLYARMVKNTYGQPEVFGGITSTKDEPALTIGPTARPWTGCSNDSVYSLVDSGASGYNFDDAIIPGFRDRHEEHKVLDVQRKIATAGRGELMLTAAFLGKTAPHSAIGMQSPYKMLPGTREGAGSETSSSHRRPVLRAY